MLSVLKIIIALLINIPMLLWLSLKPPSTADLLKIIEAEKETKNQKPLEDMKRKQSHLSAK